MVKREPQVGVAIVNYNSGPLLRDCLLAVRRHIPTGLLPPAVVDNGSTDDSLALAEEAFSELRIHRNETNVGFAAAANQAAFPVCTP